MLKKNKQLLPLVKSLEFNTLSFIMYFLMYVVAWVKGCGFLSSFAWAIGFDILVLSMMTDVRAWEISRRNIPVAQKSS